MTTKNVLLLGVTGVVIEDAQQKLGMPNLRLVGGTGLDDVRSCLAEGGLDHVVMGAGIDLETRLEIIREVFQSSDTTTVHMKDRISGKQGFLPFARSVLRGLNDYEPLAADLSVPSLDIRQDSDDQHNPDQPQDQPPRGRLLPP